MTTKESLIAEIRRLETRIAELETSETYWKAVAHQAQFKNHLRKASKEVATWPNWKKNVLGGFNAAQFDADVADADE